MNSIEDRARALAGALFDGQVVPLAAARTAAGKPAYFPLAGSPGARSYFDEPAVRVMTPDDFAFPGGGTAEGLVDALAAHWAREGESGLVGLIPGLREVAGALRQEAAEGDGNVSILCYTMF